jgi:thiosulfate/3-mercaptopyruvate sulfurtransferase
MSSMNFRTLIDADALRSLIDSGRPVVIVDTGFDLANPASGERDHAAGHLPGAVYLHLDRDLSGAKTGRNGRHPQPERAAFAATLGRIGVAPGVQVVAYDRQGGPYAARLWWMLRWLGHGEAAVLDGGVEAWRAAGGALVTTPAAPAALPPYPLDRTPLAASLDAAALLRRLGRHPLIDARSGERFRGEAEPIDPVAGHIPGASHRFHKDNLAADGRFKPAPQLREEFAALVGVQASGDVVHQCGSGVTACHNLLAMEHAGLAGSMLYPGSWSEWSSDPARPIATG